MKKKMGLSGPFSSPVKWEILRPHVVVGSTRLLDEFSFVLDMLYTLM